MAHTSAADVMLRRRSRNCTSSPVADGAGGENFHPERMLGWCGRDLQIGVVEDEGALAAGSGDVAGSFVVEPGGGPVCSAATSRIAVIIGPAGEKRASISRVAARAWANGYACSAVVVRYLLH